MLQRMLAQAVQMARQGQIYLMPSRELAIK